LPVFDFNTMIHHVYHALRQDPYPSGPPSSAISGK
jgi:hypothetical protein